MSEITGWILRDEETATTLLLPNWEILRKFPRRDLAYDLETVVSKLEKESKYPPTVIPEEISNTYKLQTGMKVTVSPDGKITSFPDCNLPRREEVTKVAKRTSLVALNPEYPTTIFPLAANAKTEEEQYLLGCLELLGCVIGPGSRVIASGPPNCGKSVALRAMLGAFLSLTNPNQRVLVAHVGERAEDGTEFQKLINGSPPKKVEYYQSPYGDPPDCQYVVAELVFGRARYLCELGYDVVLVFDSISRVLMSHNMGSIYKGSSGMISGGISNASLLAISELISLAGNYRDRNPQSGVGTLTTILSALAPAKNSRSSESIFLEQSGPSWASVIFPFMELQGNPYPWIEMNSVSPHREIKQMLTPEQLSRIAKIQSDIKGLKPWTSLGMIQTMANDPKQFKGKWFTPEKEETEPQPEAEEKTEAE